MDKMPFKGWFKRNKSHSEPSSPTTAYCKEKKALFGLKAIQAKQNPEPTYDLSNCSSPTLPDDTFTFCKILGKTSLNLKNNCLTSLESGGSFLDLSKLDVLDASYNKIEKLPSDIKFLENLTILNLSVNKLKHLPDSFKSLVSLKKLYLSSNKFSQVPPVICALAKLEVLTLNDNNIKKIPHEINYLHRSLNILKLDWDKIKNLPENVDRTLAGIMAYFCELEGIPYTGPEEDLIDNTESSCKVPQEEGPCTHAVDDIMLEYMRKKQDQLNAQILEEERIRILEKKQLESIISHSSKSKDELLQELASSPFELRDYEDKKQEKILDQLKLEEVFRNTQEEQIDLYINNTSNKEALLMDISEQENDLQNEIEAVVTARERENSKMLKELSEAERNTELALKELIQLQQAPKSQEYVSLIKDQDEKMQQILSGIAEVSTELRRQDVLKTMQNLILEEALIETQREKIEKKQSSWLSSVLKEEEMEGKHIQDLLNEKAHVQEEFLESFLQEEEYMAEAFKILLLKMDLKRSNIIRQISLVEYELAHLSAMELRKKQLGIQYGSTTMLNQRQTLVGLLKSLLKTKKERDDELDIWVKQLASRKKSGLTAEDFWLLQYQQLMMMKPTGVAEAEADLEPKVHKILSIASAMDLIPLFAKQGVTFSKLIDMSYEDFASMDIGSATYNGIQRALHTYLARTKLGSQASYEEQVPSAPPLNEEEAAATTDMSPMDTRATAPPLEAQFIETECVVCLNSDCQVLFMPCGHVCVCPTCCQSILACPLCRCNISEKCFINAHYS